MSGFFNLGKWIRKKSSKGAKAIDKVKPTMGSTMKKAFMDKYRDKRNKAKITQSQMKVEKDIETGYKSVFKDTGLKEKVNKILNKKPFKDD